jgi:hypothetical protein
MVTTSGLLLMDLNYLYDRDNNALLNALVDCPNAVDGRQYTSCRVYHPVYAEFLSRTRSCLAQCMDGMEKWQIPIILGYFDHTGTTTPDTISFAQDLV